MVERIRKVLRKASDPDDGFIFTCGEGGNRTFVEGCWLELHFTLSEREYWTYSEQFPTGRSCRTAVKNDLRLTFKGNRNGVWHVLVAIRPRDADARYHTSDVDRLAEYVERDFRRCLFQPLPR